MKEQVIKLIGIKLFEISEKQTEKFKTYSINDEYGGQLIVTFNKVDGSFYGNHTGYSEDFNGYFNNNILNFHGQNGKTIVLSVSEFY